MNAGDNFGIHRGNNAGSKTNNNNTSSSVINDDRTQGQVLSDFLGQLEDYTPTVCIECFLILIYD